MFLTPTLFAVVWTQDSDYEQSNCVPGLLAEGLEEVKSVEPDTIEGCLRIKPEWSGSSLWQGAIELPRFASNEVRNGGVHWHGADEVPLIPVVEEVVGAHRRVLLDRYPGRNYRTVCDQMTTLSCAG